MNTIELLLSALRREELCYIQDDPEDGAPEHITEAIAAGEAELKREPLTDKRIIEIRKATNTKACTAWADTLAFARAIEKEIK